MCVTVVSITITEKRVTSEKIGPYDFFQPPSGNRAGADPFLLTDFAFFKVCKGRGWQKEFEPGFKQKQDVRIIDLGTGAGVIPLYICSLLLSASGLNPGEATRPSLTITSVEKNPVMAFFAERNIHINGLSSIVDLVQTDWRTLYDRFPEGSFTHVISNPPYIKKGTGRVSPNEQRSIARCESDETGTMRDLVQVSRHLVGAQGAVYLIYPVARYCELTSELHQAGLKPRRVCLVYTGTKKTVKLFIIEAVPCGRESRFKITDPVFL